MKVRIVYRPIYILDCIPVNVAVILGAGTQWYEAYAAVNNYGRLMVGGFSTNGSVGSAGGWLAGGGHSPLSPDFGLGETLQSDHVSPKLIHGLKASITL